MRCGVVGNPVSHSLSPFLHRRFARILQRDLTYAAYEVGGTSDDSGEFSDFARDFFRNGGFGLNVTLPFKGAALACADSASAFAKRARAANTLARRENGIFACNTDGAGLTRDIVRNWGFQPRGRRILLIGAGGAGRAAAHALGDLAPAGLAIVNRTAERAAELSREVGESCGIVAIGAALDDFSGAFDLVVNAVSAGHSGAAPDIAPEIFREAELAYDLSYGAAAQPFLELARRGGAKRAADGLGMLAEQAALSCAVWTGAMPSTRGILAELRADAGA